MEGALAATECKKNLKPLEIIGGGGGNIALAAGVINKVLPE